MPSFCRHNRFIERCPICSKTLPAQAPAQPRATSRRTNSSAGTQASSARGESRARLRVRRELRAQDDGYRCELLPGLRSSQDARRLADEVGFASGRLHTLRRQPPGPYAEAVSQPDLEQASWICFLVTYISPLQGDDPFAGIYRALAQAEWHTGRLPDLQAIPLGPRSSHEPARGEVTLAAYRRWAEQAGSQAAAFGGETAWGAQRRFERVFERLALPGLGRFGRFDLLLTLGALGLYELQADSLHFSSGASRSSDDATTTAAKRVFAIGDAVNLERRAAALAEAIGVPLGVLDLALANWQASERATLGMPEQTGDQEAFERALAAFDL